MKQKHLKTFRYLFLIFSVFFTEGKIIAQTCSTSWGTPFGVSSRLSSTSLNFIQKDSITETTFWLRSSHGNEGLFARGIIPYIEKFDSHNNLILSKSLYQINFPEKNDSNSVTIEDAIIVNSKIILLTSTKDKKNDIFCFFLHELTYDGTLSSNSIKVLELKSGSKWIENSFKISPDSTKLLVLIRQDELNEKYYSFNIYDTNLNQISSKNIYQKGEEFLLLFHWLSEFKAEIDNQGTTFLLSNNPFYLDKAHWVGLYKYEPETGELTEHQLELDTNKIIEDYFFKVNPEGKVIVTGFYQDKLKIKANNKSFFHGSFYLSIDKTTMDTEIKTNELPEGFVYSNSKFKSIDKSDGGLIIFYENGSFVEDRPGSFADIRIINYDRDGNVIYTTLLSKEQSNKVFSGYLFTFNNDNNELKIVFNDNIKNLNTITKKNITAMPSKDPSPVLISIDNNGNVTKNILSTDTHTTLCPKISYKLTNSDIMIYGIENKKIKFGTLVLP